MHQLQHNLAKAVTLVMLCLLCPVLALAQSSTGSKKADAAALMAEKRDLLEKARAIREQNLSRINDIERRKRQIIEESVASRLETDVNQLKTSLKEHLERQDFWDRIIFEIDSHFAGGDIREFLKNRLVEMANVEAKSPNAQNLMKLFRYTSDVIKSLPGRKDDVLATIEGYVRSTSPENPDDPQKFISRQDYSNGTHSESANSVSKDMAGDIAERRLQELRALAKENDTAAPSLTTTVQQ